MGNNWAIICNGFGRYDLLLPHSGNSLATTKRAQQAGKIGHAGQDQGKWVDIFAA